MGKKPSFFDRLTGASYENDFQEFHEENPSQGRVPSSVGRPATPAGAAVQTYVQQDEPGEAQLTVDVYQTDNEVIIRALVAGVRPEDLDISITRDMVTIRGKRVEQKDVADDSYVYRELYWGAFSRTIVLPSEVDVDMAEADQKHGLMTIRLPKINKDRQTKLKVRGG